MAVVDLELEAPLAHDAIRRGRWDDAAPLIEAVESEPDPRARAWKLAFSAAQALARGRVPIPDRASVAALSLDDDVARRAARAAADYGAVATLASFDLAEHRAWAELAARCDPSDESSLRAPSTELRFAFADGDLARALDIARSVDDGGSDRALVVEARCVEAMCALTLGRDDDARTAARRASRLAREGELRSHRYLSGLVLSRVRRALGRGHLAGRIACALRPIAPPAFHGWLRWELVLAGQEPLPASEADPANRAANALSAVLAAAAAGETDAFEPALDELRTRTRGIAFLAPEVETLAVLLDPSAPVLAGDDAVSRFASGEIASVPLGLGALSSRDKEARPVAVVVRRPDAPPRRILAVAGPLVRDAATLPLTRLRKGRLDLACAVLALAPNGVTVEELFHACYGFRYVRHLHESLLSMVVGRVRERFEGVLDVTRRRGVVRLDGPATVLVPDPRCVAGVEQKLLKLIARLGATTARAAARELGVSLRTVQDTVARLVAEGELIVDRAHRSIGYRIDDTSFAELTPR